MNFNHHFSIIWNMLLSLNFGAFEKYSHSYIWPDNMIIAKQLARLDDKRIANDVFKEPSSTFKPLK